MILKLVVSCLAGALTGWITNDVAVKMLFKKYFGFGGVIEKEYESFVKSISELVERDLVNHKTLKDEFSSDKFKEVLHEIVKIIFISKLPQISGHKQISEIAEIDKTADNIGKFIDSVQSPLLENILNVYRQKQLDSVVSSEQFDYIIDTNVQRIFDDLEKHTDILEEAIYEFCKTHSVGTLIPPRILRQFISNIKDIIKSLDFKKCDDDLNSFFYNFMDIIDIDNIISTLRDKIATVSFSDFINDKEYLSKAIIERAIEFLKSNEGKKLLEESGEIIIAEASNIDLKLSQMLPSNFNNSIEQFINNELPSILDNIVSFIKKHKDEVDELINNAVDIELDASVYGKIVNFIKDLFIDNLSRSNDIVGKIVREIQNYGDNSGTKITQDIITGIKQNSIGDLILEFRNSSFYNKSFLAELIQNNLELVTTVRDNNFLDSFLDNKIEDTFDNLISKVRSELLPNIWSEIKDSLIYNDFGLKKNIITQIDIAEEKSKNRMIADYFPRDKIAISFEKEQITQFLRSQRNQLSSISLESIIPPINRPFDWLDYWKNNKNIKLNKLYTYLQNDSIYTKIENGANSIIEVNLEKALTGNIAAMVKNELSKSDPSQIKDMVEDFMGKELKPINTLGAILGASAGTAYTGGLMFFYAPNQLVWVTPLVYSVTGVLTNHIALLMLFRPYKKKRYLPYFSPGVVTKKKPEFALNIADFIKDNMLNDESLKKLFKANKEKIKVDISSFLRQENYEVINSLIQDDSLLDSIADFTFSTFISLLDKKSYKIIQFIVDSIDDAREEHLDSIIPQIKKWVIKELYNINFTPKLLDFIAKKIEPQPLEEYEEFLYEISNSLCEKLLDIITSEMDSEKIKKWIRKQEDNYKKFIKNKSVKNLAGSEFVTSVSQEIVSKLIPYLQKEENFEPFWKYLQKQEFKSDTKLTDAFSGILPKLLKQNISFLIDKAVVKVGENRSRMKEQIQNDMGWIKRQAVGGYVSGIVDRIIDRDLPAFLNRKKGELGRIGENVLYNYTLKDVGIGENAINLSTLQKSIVLTITKPKTQASIEKLLKGFINVVADLKIKDILSFANIKKLDDLIKIFDPLIEESIDIISNAIATSKAPLTQEIKMLFKKIIQTLLFDVKVKSLLNRIDKEKFVNHLEKIVKGNEPLKKALSILLENLIYEVTKDGSFYNKEILNDDLITLLQNSIKENRDDFSSFVKPLIKDFFSSLNGMIEQGTKDEVIGYFIDSLLDAIEISFKEILVTIDLKKVIENEVNEMSPKEVEEMFYSFAGDYFKKIKKYGAFGGVFALGDLILKLFI